MQSMVAFLTKCNLATNILDLNEKIPTCYEKMLGYWCEFKINHALIHALISNDKS